MEEKNDEKSSHVVDFPLPHRRRLRRCKGKEMSCLCLVSPSSKWWWVFEQGNFNEIVWGALVRLKTRHTKMFCKEKKSFVIYVICAVFMFFFHFIFSLLFLPSSSRLFSIFPLRSPLYFFFFDDIKTERRKTFFFY